MAELLNQQAMTPMDIPQQAGVRISPYAGLAKMLQSYSAGKMQEKALQQQAALAEKYQAGNQADVGAFMQAIQGAPAKELAGPAPQGAPQGVSQTEVTQPYTDAQGVQYKGGEPTQGGYIQPAQAPDRQRAMALALGSQNPTLQGAGGAMLSQMLTPPESAFAKLNPKDYTPDSVKLFMATGGKDFSVLKPLEKLITADTGKTIQGLNPYTFEPVGTAINKTVGIDTEARLKQDRELSDRAFNGLSANQRASLGNEAKRIGISAQELFFNTGMQAGGGNAPAPAVAPNAPTMRPPIAGAPVPNAPVGGAYTPLNQLSPKAQQEVAKAAAIEQIVPKPLTEFQGKSTAYGMRMEAANKILTDMENKGVTNTGNIRSAISGAVGLTPFVGEKLESAVQSSMNPLPGVLGGPSSQQQQVDQARRNFVTAVLRQESGASISPSEFANEERKYFPQMGDTADVLKQKQNARELAIKAMNIQAGPKGAQNIAPQGDPLGLR
jgi:hypothetical protein